MGGGMGSRPYYKEEDKYMSVITIEIGYPTDVKTEDGAIVFKNRLFVATDVKGRMIRQAIKISKLSIADVGVADLDEMVSFVVDIFGRQFTVDDFYDGVNAVDMIPELLRCINALTGGMVEKVTALPNAEAGK
jgi:hypothetical protein